jgi:hypothetical protein
MAIAKKSSRTTSTRLSPPVVAAIFLALGVGYFLGSQRALLQSIDEPSSLSSSLASFASRSHPAQTQITHKNSTATAATTTKSVPNGNDNDDSNVFRLHPSIKLPEDPESYRKLFHPPVQKLTERGTVQGCPLDPVKPYLDILRTIENDPKHYEDDKTLQNNNSSNQTCPVVFLFYFEGGSKIADTFFDYYSNIETKRCLKFIVSSRWIDKPGTKEMAASHGYDIVGKHYPKQDKTISQSLYEIQKNYGDDVLVSVNDLDHLLVWFHNGVPHRYSSYTDMVRLYVYELLTTRGCSNQNVMEKYVVPCTCLMEKNEQYVSTVFGENNKGVIWSEYGVTNRFHPTGNFYLNRSLALPDDGDSEYVYSIGTVFANLRKYEVSSIRIWIVQNDNVEFVGWFMSCRVVSCRVVS